MSTSIIGEAVAKSRMKEWGVVANDYILNGKRVDFQDLMIYISEARATAIEREITPLADIMRKRNQRLSLLGETHSALSSISAKYDAEKTNPTESGTFSGNAIQGLIFAATRARGSSCITAQTNNGIILFITSEINVYLTGNDVGDFSKNAPGTTSLSKSSCDYITQLIKSTIDALNNDSQSGITRMQSLVDKRDESFTTATSLMTHISDSRSSLIKNL